MKVGFVNFTSLVFTAGGFPVQAANKSSCTQALVSFNLSVDSSAAVVIAADSSDTLKRSARAVISVMARAAPRQPGPPAGVIFGCNRSSEEESLNGLFGMSSGHWSLVKEIIPGTPCFLFNFNTKVSFVYFDLYATTAADCCVPFQQDSQVFVPQCLFRSLPAPSRSHASLSK